MIKISSMYGVLIANSMIIMKSIAMKFIIFILTNVSD